MRSLPFVKYQLKKAVPKPKKVFGRFAYFMVKVGVVQPTDYLYMLLWVEQYRLPFAIGIFIFVQAYTIAYDKVALGIEDIWVDIISRKQPNYLVWEVIAVLTVPTDPPPILGARFAIVLQCVAFRHYSKAHYGSIVPISDIAAQYLPIACYYHGLMFYGMPVIFYYA